MRLDIELVYIYFIANRTGVSYTFSRARYYYKLTIDKEDKPYKD